MSDSVERTVGDDESADEVCAALAVRPMATRLAHEFRKVEADNLQRPAFRCEPCNKDFDEEMSLRQHELTSKKHSKKHSNMLEVFSICSTNP